MPYPNGDILRSSLKRWWPGGEKDGQVTLVGAMPRTGQSLLATVRLHLHLRRST
jgi:hypothetical protein